MGPETEKETVAPGPLIEVVVPRVRPSYTIFFLGKMENFAGLSVNPYMLV
jgi:hypothetical protein